MAKMRKEYDKVDVSLGNELRNIRKQKRMTLQYVADRIGCTKGLISFYESGHTAVSIPQLIKLCDVYNVSYADVLNAVRKIVYSKK